MNNFTLSIKGIAVALLFSSCFDATSTSEKEGDLLNNSVSEPTSKTSSLSPQAKKRPIKYFPIKDPQKNILMALMPIPSDWKISDKKKPNIFLESPKGVQTFYTVGNEYMYSDNNYSNEDFRRMGFETKPPQSFEQVLEEIKGMAKKENVRLINQYELPQLATADRNFDRLLFKGIPEQKEFKVVATEWTDDKGGSSIAIFHYFIAYTETALYWGYNIDLMEAPEDHFSIARRDFINALLNTQINPQWLDARNQKVRQQSATIQANHEQRMATLRAQGDQIIANGKAHDAMTTRTHQKFMDGLLDKVNITNPSTGQSYKVDLGSNHYWINDNNQLITSDNANYNPNGDQNINGTWIEAQINN